MKDTYVLFYRVLFRVRVIQKPLRLPGLVFFPSFPILFLQQIGKSYFASASSFVTQKASDQEWTY